MSRLPTLSVLAVAAIGAGCATPAHEPHEHTITTTITVTDDAVLPQAVVPIPVVSSLVWRNRGTAPLEVSIRMTTCGGCETVMGFRAVADGARAMEIAPGAIATICFHERGAFPFVARIGGAEYRGEIRVGDAP
jgi:hypothetical protein